MLPGRPLPQGTPRGPPTVDERKFSDSFPTFWSARSGDHDEDPGEAEQRWEALQPDEQWQRGMAALRRRPQDQLEIRPDWADYRFGHELSFTDLLADDRAERMERAFSPGPSQA
ncbi:hypothetical protein [[Kitasatospora] papulosa]|uniref:hypothetical protein n=1 Tax=[Kitasatospora] papulosa TaxID=1464011 RepID=UPI00368B6B9B